MNTVQGESLLTQLVWAGPRPFRRSGRVCVGEKGCGSAEISKEGHLGEGAGTRGSEVGTSSCGGMELSDGGWPRGPRHCVASGCSGVELAVISELSNAFFL